MESGVAVGVVVALELDVDDVGVVVEVMMVGVGDGETTRYEVLAVACSGMAGTLGWVQKRWLRNWVAFAEAEAEAGRIMGAGNGTNVVELMPMVRFCKG